MGPAIIDRKTRPMNSAEKGQVWRIELADWAAYPGLHTLRKSDDIVELEAPLYLVLSAERVRGGDTAK